MSEVSINIQLIEMDCERFKFQELTFFRNIFNNSSKYWTKYIKRWQYVLYSPKFFFFRDLWFLIFIVKNMFPVLGSATAFQGKIFIWGIITLSLVAEPFKKSSETALECPPEYAVNKTKILTGQTIFRIIRSLS